MSSRVLAAIAMALSLGVLAAAFAITQTEGDRPASWFVLVVATASIGLGYGTAGGAHRRGVLLASSGALVPMGLLGLLTVGLPLLLAAALGFVAALTQPRARSGAAGP
ncbi:MAG: hypothetical protein ABIN79_07055 [Marmoricola sp.]